MSTRACPYCDVVLPEGSTPWDEIAHMESAHPDVIADRLASSGLAPQDSSPPVATTRESSAPTAMTDKQMEARLGKPRGKLQMVVLSEATYRRLNGVWEPYDD